MIRNNDTVLTVSPGGRDLTGSQKGIVGKTERIFPAILPFYFTAVVKSRRDFESPRASGTALRQTCCPEMYTAQSFLPQSDALCNVSS